MSDALVSWARQVLSSAALALPPPRLRHSAGVARRADFVGAALLSGEDARLLRAAAWLHDIGHAAGLVDTGCHAIDGARHLRRLGAPDDVVGLVAYHSGAEDEAAERGLREEIAQFPRPVGDLLDVLTFADLTTDVDGHQISVEGRINGILDRYAGDDPVRVSVGFGKAHLVSSVGRIESRLARNPPSGAGGAH